MIRISIPDEPPFMLRNPNLEQHKEDTGLITFITDQHNCKKRTTIGTKTQSNQNKHNTTHKKLYTTGKKLTINILGQQYQKKKRPHKQKLAS